MSEFRLTINLDNDAFAGEDCAAEVRRILSTVINHTLGLARSDLPNYSPHIMDMNGNRCGEARFTFDEEEDEPPHPDRHIIDGLTREQLVFFLTESCGIECFDDESIGVLRETLMDQVVSGRNIDVLR